MAFPESIKLEVKKKAAFRCCWCQNVSVEIHHIIPEKDKGSDDIDNAAPLCPSCHSLLGDNPMKRKEIKEKRDWWYEEAKKMFSGAVGLDVLEKISNSMEEIKEGQKDFSELKTLLKEVANKSIESITKETASTTASGIINAVQATTLGDKVHANFVCRNCGTRIGLLIGSNNCPNCKTPIN
ncbi:MAG: HNH endonuclease [Candidatus Gracilibacteria bacterium]|nr:HNH endonuclease [Candidatus Gracilibacteria bacterium]MDD5178897.1 HNH endonuclease [Candidatus Gracilibacteria bacterium]